ncbi:MAG: leucine-rich repeat protein [Acutalibacteraceae bacterium]|nr:leucine-rich repeat protein [Acutalibacteraceae bacterium]
MKRKIRIAVLFILCVALTGTMLFFGVNSIKAEASERTITASGTNMKVNWTLYDDGELYIDGTGFWNGTPWKSHYSSIKKITIAQNVTSSSALGFYFDVAEGYDNLESVSVEEGNTEFFSDENGVLYSKDKTKIYLFPAASELTEYFIPDSVETIGRGAFCGSKNVAEITGCKGLKTVSENAFYFSSLENITLPNGTETVGRHAFFNSSLKNITVPDSVITIGAYAFKGCSELETAIIGSGITGLTTDTFSGCTALSKISLPEGLKTVGQNAFENCSALTEVNLPDGLTSLLSNAFSGCSSLKSIVVPEGITTLSAYLFKNCTSLKNVTLPSNLKSASSFAFSGCKAVENVYYTGDEAGWSSIKFGSNSSNPLEFADDFYIDGKLVTEFAFPYGTTEISSYVFKNYDKLKNVTIPNTVKSIGEYAFNYCKALESIDIPDSVTYIGEHAFSYCSSLYDVSASANLEYIGKSAFFYSGYYNDYANWDNGFLYLDDYLLSADADKVAADCRIYSKTRLIAAGAFNAVKGITSVTMGDKVEYINAQAFYNCSNLRSVHLSSNLKKISDSSFASCSALESINVPQSVSAIEDKAFWMCTSLTETDIPKNVVSIGNSAFCGCEKLEKISLSEGLETIGSSAFAETSSLTEISLPSSLTSLSSGAFKSSAVSDIYYGSTKADWKRVASGQSLGDITIHYTLRSEDESVIIHHTDNNFDWEAGNVHLVVEDLGDATSSYEQNGFYNRLMVDPIQVLDIKLVDGDGNDIQPLSNEKITVKIKASEEFMNLMKSGLSAVGEYDVETKDIDFFNDCFAFEVGGETVFVPADESFLKKFKIIHWYSDATQPTDHESFTHDEISVENGYIVLETNHFSEYAVCTEYTPKQDYTIKWNVDGVVTEQTVTEESTIIKPANPEKEGYTFVGWTPEVPDTMPAQNLEFTAVWQVNKYTVTFDTAGGTAIAPITLEYGAAIAPTANPEKDGYTFIGWNPELPETMPANNLTVVAVYEEAETPEVPEITVTGIKIIALPNKTQYTYKVDSFDLSGLVIKLMYSDGTSKIISDTKAVTTYGFDAGSVGTKTITVSYGGYTDEFEITVSYAWWQWIIRILLLGFIWY